MVREGKTNTIQGSIVDAYQTGYSSEALFIYEAIRRGFNVSTPFNGNSVYDAVLDNGRRLYRIQCKSCNCFSENQFKVTVSKGCKSKAKYLKNEVDFFVIYIIPENTWYIIPFKECNSKTVALFAHNPESKGQYEKYIEAWELFN